MSEQIYRRANILKSFQTLLKYDAFSKHDNDRFPLPLVAYYDPDIEEVIYVTEVDKLPIAATVNLLANELKIIAQGIVTITTAGTPVALPSNTSAKAVIVYNGNSTGVIIVVGKATINAVTEPPVGLPLVFPYSNSGVLRVMANSNEIYVDASINGTKLTYSILG